MVGFKTLFVVADRRDDHIGDLCCILVIVPPTIPFTRRNLFVALGAGCRQLQPLFDAVSLL